jgi:Tfp pilus assembly protein PilN
MPQDLDLSRRLDVTPRINLLPGALLERRAVKRQRAVLALAAGGLLAALAAAYVGQASHAARARQDAVTAQATVTRLTGDKAKLQPWAQLKDQVTALEQLRASVYQHEVRLSGVLQDLSMIVPDNVYLTQMSATIAPTVSSTGTAAAPAAGTRAAAGTTPPGAPGAGSPLGTISFAGTALAHVDVATFVRTLDSTIKKNGQPVYINPYFTSSQKQAGGSRPTVSFTATADLGPAAVSGRFQQRDDVTGGK